MCVWSMSNNRRHETRRVRMDGKETTNRGAPSAAAGKGRRLAAPGHGKASGWSAAWSPGSARGRAGDATWWKGLIFTEHFRGKHCRINETGYVTKCFWGLTGVGGGKGSCSHFDGQSYKQQFFSFPIQKHHTLGHFSLKRRYGDNQSELCATGKVKRK